MSFFHAAMLAGASGNQGPYQIEQSLRFNSEDSAYLNRTPGSAGNRKTWTWSGWVKYTVKNASAYNQPLFWASSVATTGISFSQNPNTAHHIYVYNAGEYIETTQFFRDPSSWYHIVAVIDTTQATASNRTKLYINGVQVTDFVLTAYPTQNADGDINNTVEHNIGKQIGQSRYLDAYLAEVNFIDGSALDPTDFGEYDDNGVWRAIKYAGSYTGNSFYLKFDAADVDGDSSGLGNDWTANNISTSGTGTDVMSDTPTTNYATLNPLLNQGGSFSEGNLVFTGVGTSYQGSKGTIAIPLSGKWYWETTATTHTTTASNWTAVGMATEAVPLTSFAGEVTGSVFYGDRNDANSLISNDTSVVDQGTTTSFSQGDILQCAYDADTGKFWFGLNNSWWDSSVGTTGNPSAGTNETLTAVSREYFPFVQTNRTHVMTINFGQRDFAYTPPTGYKALNTANLPAPDIADGSEYFNTVLYNGNGSTQSITGVGFQPDWVWLKSRNNSYHNYVFDVIRGTGEQLYTNLTNEEFTSSGTLTSFDTDGFSLGNSANADINNSGATFVAWNWLAGGSVSADNNTDGTITSTVSANPTAGFSIVSYVGNNTAGATIGHGLGVKPDFIVVKDRDGAPGWQVYHSGVGATKYLRLDNNNGATTQTNRWNDTEPTATVFSVGNAAGTNGNSGDNYIAYCFAEVENYSRIGSYTGNGDNTGAGPFVWCGFKPAFIVMKSSSASDNWRMYDDKRLGYNPDASVLYPNLGNQESVSDHVDIFSNGFKLRSNNNNSDGVTYIFFAFASNPFGGDGVSPATAR